jgi:hypothetical protein
MTQADHYRDQSHGAQQLAKAVKDPEASKKLIEMAEEFRRLYCRAAATDALGYFGSDRSSAGSSSRFDGMRLTQPRDPRIRLSLENAINFLTPTRKLKPAFTEPP